MELSANEEPSLPCILRQLSLNMADCSLKWEDVAVIVGAQADELIRFSERRPPQPYAEDRMRRLNALIDYASLIFGGRDAAGLWLRRPNQALTGCRSPMRMLIDNSMALHQLCRILEEQCLSTYLLPLPRGGPLWV